MNGIEFKLWRARHNLTQAEAASKFNVTRGTVQNWEATTGPLSRLIEQNCNIWSDRLTQIRPDFGPVTLIYADGSMFRSAYAPSRTPTMVQEPFATNALAVARALDLWGKEGFFNPFILAEGGHVLWNFVQLQRVVKGHDDDAPLWRCVFVDDRDPTVGEANAKGLVHAVARANRDRGLPQDVALYRDRSVTDEYCYIFSPNAFAICAADVRQISTRIEYSAEPPARSDLVRINI